MGFSACGYHGDFLTLNGDFLTLHGVFLTIDVCNLLKSFRARERETRKKQEEEKPPFKTCASGAAKWTGIEPHNRPAKEFAEKVRSRAAARLLPVFREAWYSAIGARSLKERGEGIYEIPCCVRKAGLNLTERPADPAKRRNPQKSLRSGFPASRR